MQPSTFDPHAALRERLALLPETFAAPLLDRDIHKKIDKQLQQFVLNETERDAIGKVVIYLLLMYVPLNELPDAIMANASVERPTAERIANTILSVLPQQTQDDLIAYANDLVGTSNEDGGHTTSEVETTIDTSAPTKKTPVSSVPSAIPTAPPPPPSTTVSDGTPTTPTPEPPAAPVSDPRLVQPMHTMGSDVSQVHGYQAYRSLFPDEHGLPDDTPTAPSSSQDELLTRKPRLSETPSYHDPDAPNA